MDIKAFLDHWFTRLSAGGAIGLAVALAVNVFIIGDPFRDAPVNVGFFLFWGVNALGVAAGMYIARKLR